MTWEWQRAMDDCPQALKLHLEVQMVLHAWDRQISAALLRTLALEARGW